MAGQYNRKDRWYKEAKTHGFRSRAAYKLLELNKHHKFIKQGYSVLELGAWPGGWLQVAARLNAPTGVVVGIDLTQIEGMADGRIHVLTGDVRDSALIERACVAAGGSFDVVLSDLAPKLSGIREADEAQTIALAETALEVCKQALKPGGAFVVKLFKSNDSDTFVRSAKAQFARAARCELDTTRKTSSEFYLVGSGFK